MRGAVVAAGASTDCGPGAATCAHHLNNAALEAGQIEQFVANPVMLFGWSTCPCTQIARERLTAAGGGFEEYTWDAASEPLMAYLNCMHPGAAGCPLRRGKKWIATMWYREGVTAERNWEYYSRRGSQGV